MSNIIRAIKLIFRRIFPGKYQVAEVYSPETVARLVEMLKDADEQTRRNGCAALEIMVCEWSSGLSLLDNQETITLLKKLQNDSNELTRKNAQSLLELISSHAKKDNTL